MLERVVYVSRAVAGTGIEEVFTIIRASHARNGEAGISGGLIFLDGWFAQVLEGPGPALDACLGRIARDARHVMETRDARHLSETRNARRAEPGAGALRSRERGLCRLFPGQALALRGRGALKADLFEDFAYRPGFPVAVFPADVLIEFVVRACRRDRRASRRRGPAPAQGLARGAVRSAAAAY